LGLAGSLLAFFGRGIGAGVLMLAASVGPGLLGPYPANLLAFGFSSVLFIAGVLAFFVRAPSESVPRKRRPRSREDDDGEEELPKPKRKRRKPSDDD
jgi:hypothetical protein